MGKIIWLASYPKSGNTWLRAFLHNLLRDPAAAPDINRIRNFTVGEPDLRWYRPLLPGEPTSWTQEAVAGVRAKAHHAMTKTSPDSVFVKTHLALVAYKGVPLITLESTAGAIYLLRNPLDVAISFSHHLGQTLDETIEFMNDPGAQSLITDKQVFQIYRSWSEHVTSWTALPGSGLLVLRFEDMLEGPEDAFGRVVRFLGLSPPRERLQRAIARSSFAALRRQEDERGFAEKSPYAERFFRDGRAGQWRERLSTAQIESLVAAHRPVMERFGYLP